MEKLIAKFGKNRISKRIKTSKTLKNKRKKKALSKPDIFREFVVWMSIPEPLRKPKTQQEFAKRFKVSEWTLSQWKKRDDFWKEVEAEWNKWGREKTSNVMLKFYNKVMREGTTPDFKLWFQYFLRWSEKIEEKVSGGIKIIHEYADEEKDRNSKDREKG